jgi:hypothetical protein
LPWAELLKRVFAEDLLACPCGGRRRVLCFITDTDVAREILTALGLPADIPIFASARAPPQATFDDWQSQVQHGDMGGNLGNPLDEDPPDDFADPQAWDESDDR